MSKDLNKNISVWRGSNIPPTDYHLWVKENGDLLIKLSDSWITLIKHSSISDIEQLISSLEKLNEIKIEEIQKIPNDLYKQYKLVYDNQQKGVTIDIPKSDSQIETEEDGFFITDKDLNVILKIDSDGLDVNKLSDHFVSMIPNLSYEIF